MTRQIKFRVWDTERKKFCFLDKDSFLISILPSEGKIEIERSKKYEIVQFTGLKDKISKEIYEGDLVKILKSGAIGKVVYGHAGFCLDVGSGLISMHFNPSEIEVVGNIYENPELLK